jgi:DNA-binding transcriptional LysR family regulator
LAYLRSKGYVMLKNPLNLRQVEIFHAVMSSGTTRRAAEILHISQPGISKAIKELEHELGFALFHRTRRRLTPTTEARLYLREVEDSFASLSRLRSAAARIRDFGSGQIRIATLSALSTNIVPRALKRFCDENPQISISLQARMSTTVRDLVLTGGFDIGLAADEVDTTGVEARPLVEMPAVIALPENHPLTRKQELAPKDLDKQAFIALSPEDTTRHQLDAILGSHGASPRVVLETPFANTVCAMVQAGLGCGLVNPLTAEPFLGKGLVLRAFRPNVSFRTLLLLPTANPTGVVVQRLITALEAECTSARQALNWAWG